eukprot:2761183-Prymnesium_polylepis.2
MRHRTGTQVWRTLRAAAHLQSVLHPDEQGRASNSKRAPCARHGGKGQVGGRQYTSRWRVSDQRTAYVCPVEQDWVAPAVGAGWCLRSRFERAAAGCRDVHNLGSVYADLWHLARGPLDSEARCW